MDEERREQGGTGTTSGQAQGGDQERSQAGGGQSGGGWGSRFAKFGQKLDQALASQQLQEAKRKMAEAATTAEAKLREANVGEKLERGLEGVTKKIDEVATGPSNKDAGDRLRQLLTQLEKDLIHTLESPTGQNWRGRVAGFLHELGDAIEQGRPARPMEVDEEEVMEAPTATGASAGVAGGAGTVIASTGSPSPGGSVEEEDEPPTSALEADGLGDIARAGSPRAPEIDVEADAEEEAGSGSMPPRPPRYPAN